MGPTVDEVVKSPKTPHIVIPAKAGIQLFQVVAKTMAPVSRIVVRDRLQRGDDLLREHQT